MDIRLIKAEIMRRDFYLFLKEFWSVIDPADFKENWHVNAICDHMQYAVSHPGYRCIFNTPPRHGKSQIINVAFNAWVWASQPAIKIICSTYAASLARRDSVLCRRLIESPKYQYYFGDVFTLLDGSNSQSRFVNDHGGHRVSTSVKAAVTGEGADIILIDDPYNAYDAYSAKERANVEAWWRDSIQKRLNIDGLGIICLIMQRFTPDDLCGYIIKNETNFDVIRFPLIFDRLNNFNKSSLGFEDPRNNDGDPLLTRGYPNGYIESSKANPVSWAGQCQQNPATTSDGLIKCEFSTFNEPDVSLSHLPTHFYIDAATGDSNDYSSIGAFCRLDGKVYCKDIIRFKKKITEQVDIIEKFIHKNKTKGLTPKIKIEWASAGQSITQMLESKKYKVIRVSRKKGDDKLSRCVRVLHHLPNLIIPDSEYGRILQKEAWQFNEFDTHENDDMIDICFDAVYDLLEKSRCII